MEGRIRGSFPGGPSRRGAHEPGPRRPGTLRPVEEILADADRRRLAQRHRQRLRRIFVGVASAVVAAGSVGFALGRLAQRTPQELAEEQRAASLRDNQISGEVNRVLLELWKMEDTEGLRNVGRSR